jgi:Zn-dependent M28 family amino/carboxypeptidase
MGLTNILVAQSSLIDSIIRIDSIKHLVQVLSSDSFQGRYTGTIYATRAANFIAGEFQKAGIEPVSGNKDYFIPFTYMYDTRKGEGLNVMGVLPGKSKEMIIFSAHYDHAGTRSNNHHRLPILMRSERRDSIYNGANDNASGVSALIALARYYGQLKNNERTILFIAFAGEEQGLAGSKSMAQSINTKNVKAMINIEMIGRGTSDSARDAFITGGKLSDLQAILNNEVFETAPALYGKNFFKNDPYLKQELFSRSDNYWFAIRSIPAHTIFASSPNDPYFHTVNDEADKLNYTLMTKVIKALALASTGLINGSKSPTSIDKDQIRTGQ